MLNLRQLLERLKAYRTREKLPGVPTYQVVLALGASVVGVGMAFAAIIMLLAGSFSQSSEKSQTLLSSMRAQMTADMLHDGLRGVVFRSLYAGAIGDEAMVADTRKEVQEYSGEFRDAVMQQNRLAIPPQVVSAVAELRQPLDDYISAAGSLVNLVYAKQMETAEAKLGAFDSAFKALEDKMSALSDTIEAANAAVYVEAHQNGNLATTVAAGSVFALLGFAALVLMMSRAIFLRPLAALTTGFQKLVNDDLSVETPPKFLIREMGVLGDVQRAFKGALLERNRFSENARTSSAAITQKAEASAALNREIAAVAAAAVAGDFSKRVVTTYVDAELRQLGDTVNSLLTTVDRSITETGSVLSALAAADLTRRMEGEYAGALDQLKNDTNAVADRLADVMTQLKAASGALKTATNEILSGANDLSERTTKQAATIEETAATMEQLATTVAENAKQAQSASANAAGVANTAEESGSVMQQATHAMERITQSSAKISDIIGLIDDIAFQTNLLALNASVEAARAGEAGKGFAVVAVEVRRLAQSAAQASAEVKALIEQSAKEVTGGTRLVGDAARKLDEMVKGARLNSELLANIARQSRAQAASIDEVNVAVRQMDEMTQHNAALVEETNAAIEQTEIQVESLDEVVAVFRIADTEAHPGGTMQRRRAA
jgi:methyl-accepting chemotaxis protein